MGEFSIVDRPILLTSDSDVIEDAECSEEDFLENIADFAVG
jgi:hypothetical protein